MYRDPLNELAEQAALEIRTGFSSYGGHKWQQVDGEERAVRFTVTAPSLEGKPVRELNPRGLRTTGDFDSKLYASGMEYVDGHKTGRILHGIQYQPEIINAHYTGQVTVSDGSGAWDYDL